MRTPARNWLPLFAAWIMSSCSPNQVLKLFWKNYIPTFTPKELTIRGHRARARRCRAPRHPRCHCGDPKDHSHENCWSPFARRRMTEPRFLVVRLGSLEISSTLFRPSPFARVVSKAEIVWLTHPRWKRWSRAVTGDGYLATETRSYALCAKSSAASAKKNSPPRLIIKFVKSAALPFLVRVSRRSGSLAIDSRVRRADPLH